MNIKETKKEIKRLSADLKKAEGLLNSKLGHMMAEFCGKNYKDESALDAIRKEIDDSGNPYGVRISIERERKGGEAFVMEDTFYVGFKINGWFNYYLFKREFDLERDISIGKRTLLEMQADLDDRIKIIKKAKTKKKEAVFPVDTGNTMYSVEIAGYCSDYGECYYSLDEAIMFNNLNCAESYFENPDVINKYCKHYPNDEGVGFVELDPDDFRVIEKGEKSSFYQIISLESGYVLRTLRFSIVKVPLYTV